MGITGLEEDADIKISSPLIKVDFDAKSLVRLYNELEAIRTEAMTGEDKLTGAQRQDSEIFKTIDEWLNKMEEDVNTYKKAIEDVEKYSTNLKALEIDFSSMTNLTDFAEGRQKLIDYFKTLEDYAEKSEEEIGKVADTYIQSVTDNANEFLNKLYAINYLIEKFGEENREKITSAVENLDYEDLKYIVQVDDEKSLLSLDEFLAKAKDKAEKYHITASIKEELKNLDIDEDVFEEYVDTLQEMNKGADKLDATLDDFQDQAEAVALSIIKMNKAIETLSKNFETNRKIVEDGNEADYEYVKALAEIKEATEDILGAEVSNDFVKNHLEDIQDLVDGNVDALDRLRIEAAKDIVAHLTVDVDDTKIANDLAVIQSYIDDFSNQDLIIGSKLDDTEFIKAMNHMLQEGQITANEANQILSSIGYQPSIGVTQVPKSEVHHYTRTDDQTGATSS